MTKRIKKHRQPRTAAGVFLKCRNRDEGKSVLGRPGSDLLFQVLRLSTIGAGEFNGRVRNGIGFRLSAKTTRPAKDGSRSKDWSLELSSLDVLYLDERHLDHSSLDQSHLARTGAMSKTAREASRMGIEDKSNQVIRAISTGKLNALLRLHTRPINVVVFHGSQGSSRFEVGFPLRCFQRLSRPYIATLHCGWRHNRSTRGTFTPVLSY